MADDPSIEDDCKLYRRVPNDWIFYDENLGRFRPTSQAFDDHKDGSPMSIAIEDTLIELRLTPESVLSGHDGFSLVSFSAGFARSVGFEIERDPKPPDERAHGHVIGNKSSSKKSKLARNCEWVVCNKQK